MQKEGLPARSFRRALLLPARLPARPVRRASFRRASRAMTNDIIEEMENGWRQKVNIDCPVSIVPPSILSYLNL